MPARAYRLPFCTRSKARVRRQRRAQRLARHFDAGCARAALRLGDDALPADELQGLAFEHTEIDDEGLADA